MDLNASGPLKVNFFKKRGREVHSQTPGAFEFDIHSYVNLCSEKIRSCTNVIFTRQSETPMILWANLI